MSITSIELKNHLDQYLESAETTLVIVEKVGHRKSMLLSSEMYERFLVLEDAYWAERAKQAESEGYLGIEDSAKLVNRVQTA
jgi:antitoxin Phd